MNSSYRPTFLLLGLLITFLLIQPISAQDAKEHYNLSKQYEREGNIDLAIQEAEKAAKKDVKNWRYAWKVAELYLYKTEDRSKALDAYTEALLRGYDKPITYHKQAMCYFHLKNHEKAVTLLNYSIRENKKLLAEAEKSKNDKTASHARYQIADSYVWLTKQYRVLEKYDQFYEAATQVEVFNPKNQWLPVILHDGISRMVYNAIAEGNYKQALEYCKIEEKTVKRYDKEPDSRIPRYTLAEVLENRIQLGTITPAYTHKIMAFYINHLKTSYEIKGEQKQIDRRMTDREKRTSFVHQKVLTMLIESISNGQLSLSWDMVEINEPLRVVELSEDGKSVRPIWNTIPEFVEKYKSLVGEYDTFFKIWNGPTGEAVGGAGRLDGTVHSRGSVRIHPEHSMGIWLHEFFHVVESKVRISPTHGYYEEPRKNFPEWTGPTGNQLDYFRWHFRTTVKDFGYSNFKFKR